jgi:hypothetical protein
VLDDLNRRLTTVVSEVQAGVDSLRPRPAPALPRDSRSYATLREDEEVR